MESNWIPILLDNPIFTDIHLQPLRFTWGGAFAYWVHYVRNSELFLGQRCLEIYESEYVTDQEKKEMFKDFYSGRCARRNTRTVQSCLKRVSLKRIRRWGFEINIPWGKSGTSLFMGFFSAVIFVVWA